MKNRKYEPEKKRKPQQERLNNPTQKHEKKAIVVAVDEKQILANQKAEKAYQDLMLKQREEKRARSIQQFTFHAGEAKLANRRPTYHIQQVDGGEANAIVENLLNESKKQKPNQRDVDFFASDK